LTIGLDREQIESAFDASTTFHKNLPKSSGVGLYILKQATLQLGAKLNAIKNKQSGLSICIDIPAS